MRPITLEQRVRHAIVAHQARRSRAPTTDEIMDALAPATRAEVLAALSRLEETGYVIRRADGWSPRSPAMTARAVDAMAIRAQFRG